MYIPMLLNVHSDVFKCIFRRNGNRIPKKWEPYSEEAGTVFRRIEKRIKQKREPYSEEAGTVLRRNGNRIPKKFCQRKKEMQKVRKSKQPDITFAPKGICKKATP